MKNDLYVVIMAGGQGSRLWPLSQTKTPKQFLDLVGIGQTMLQMTYSRFEGVCPPENFVVVTNVDYEDLVREQLPKVPRENILCEPFRKNTTACIVYANTFIKQRNKDALIMVTPCDHFIVNETSFIESVREGVKYVSNTDDVLLTVGVNAHRPETLFGYIQLGSKVEGDYENVYSVKTFTEKPNEEMAQLFYEFSCVNFYRAFYRAKTVCSAGFHSPVFVLFLHLCRNVRCLSCVFESLHLTE